MSGSPFLDPVIPPPAPPDARWVWAVVTQASPLRIKIDGDRVPLGITPDDLGGGVRTVGQRVYCQILNRRLVVVGPSVSSVPPGVILDYAGGAVPSGFLLCDGAAVSRTTYAALFAAIGTTWGVGDNSTTFNLPDFRGRVAVGRDPVQSEFNSLAKMGGAKTHTLTVNEMPSHTHAQDPHVHGLNGTFTVGGLGGTGGSGIPGGNPGWGQYEKAHWLEIIPATATNQPSGGGQAHENMPPYRVVNKIIKF